MARSSIAQQTPGIRPAMNESKEIYAKVTRNIIPFLFICYVFAYLDRVNIGFAALQMKQDLNFSDAVYGFGAGVFFVGYFLFEVPSNLLLVKIGARKTLMRIMVVWGLISGSFAFIHTPLQFYIARFFLGAFEAGFFPGVVLYLTYWYPSAMRGKMIALFMSAIAVAGIVGGPLSGWIMTHMSGVYGFTGWQWMFLIEAVPSVVMGLLTLVILVDYPEKAKWLSPHERQVVSQGVAASSSDSEHSFGKALRDPRLYVLALVYFTIAAGIYVISFWLPTMIRNYGVDDPWRIGVLTAIPYLVGAVGMVLISKNSDRTMERRWHTAACMILGGAGLVAATLVPNNLVLALCALTVATTCILTTMPVFWTMPTSYLSGTAAAGGIAMINSIGLIGGFVSPSVIGWLKTATGSLTSGLYIFSGVLVVGAVLLLYGFPARLIARHTSSS